MARGKKRGGRRKNPQQTLQLTFGGNQQQEAPPPQPTTEDEAESSDDSVMEELHRMADEYDEMMAKEPKEAAQPAVVEEKSGSSSKPQRLTLADSIWATKPDTPAGGEKPAKKEVKKTGSSEVKKTQSRPASAKLVATPPAEAPAPTPAPSGNAAFATVYWREKLHEQSVQSGHMISKLEDDVEELQQQKAGLQAELEALKQGSMGSSHHVELQDKLTKAAEDLEQERVKAKLDRERGDDLEQRLVSEVAEYAQELAKSSSSISELRLKNEQLSKELDHHKHEINEPRIGLYAQLKEKDTEIVKLKELVKDVKALELVQAANDDYQKEVAKKDKIAAELKKSLSTSQQATYALQQKLQNISDVEAKLNDTEAAKIEAEQKLQAIRDRSAQVNDRLANELSALGYNLHHSVIADKPVKTSTLAEELQFTDNASDSGAESDIEHASIRHSRTSSIKQVIKPLMVNNGSQTDSITLGTFSDIFYPISPPEKKPAPEEQKLSLSKINSVFDIEPVAPIKQEEQKLSFSKIRSVFDIEPVAAIEQKLSFTPIISVETTPISPAKNEPVKMVSAGTQVDHTPMVSAGTQVDAPRMVSTSTQVDHAPMVSAGTQYDHTPMTSAGTQVALIPMVTASTQTVPEKKEIVIVDHKAIQTEPIADEKEIVSIDHKGIQTETKEIKVIEKGVQTEKDQIKLNEKAIQTDNEVKAQYQDSQTNTDDIKLAGKAAEETIIIGEDASFTFRQMVSSPSLAHAWLVKGLSTIPSYMHVILALAFLLAGMLCSAALTERTLWSTANDPAFIRDHIDTAFPRFVAVPFFGESLAQMLCDWMGIDSTPLS